MSTTSMEVVPERPPTPRYKCYFKEDDSRPATPMPPNRKKTLEWIIDFLEDQLDNEHSRFFRRYSAQLEAKPPKTPEESQPPENNQNPFEKPEEEQHIKGIQIKDFQIVSNEPSNLTTIIPIEVHPSIMSEILSLDIRFTINESEDEFVESFIVKIPAEEDEFRNLGNFAGVYKREVEFYQGPYLDLCNWAGHQKANLKFAAPYCYYAGYSRPVDPIRIKDLHERVMDAESVIVLEDLRLYDYGKRTTIQGLSLDEAKAALREIAIFHAASWTLREEHENAFDSWALESSPKDFALLFENMFEEAYPKFTRFLEKWETREPIAGKIQNKFKFIKMYSRKFLKDCLDPPIPPNPYCLIHMDFWCDNLMFRMDEEDMQHAATAREDQNPKDPESYLKNPVDLDVKIMDWQMMTVGSPMHDFSLLICTSLSPYMRRAHTDNLLEFYLRIFKKAAEEFGKKELPFNKDMLLREFRKSVRLSALLVICSIELVLADPVMEERFFELLRDLYNDELI